MPGTLTLLFFLTLLLAVTVVLVVATKGESSAAVQVGHVTLLVSAAVTVVGMLACSTNWVHLFWSVQFPMLGLFLGAGLLLLRTWEEDRRATSPGLLARWNGATLAVVGAVALGSLPVLIVSLWPDAFPPGRVAGAPLPALVQAAIYGFGGPVPDLMEPLHRAQVERGLGAPPRFVTVPMGTTLIAAIAVICFTALAFVGRRVRSDRRRRTLMLTVPLVLVPLALVALPAVRFFEDALWGNEPWLVRAYGPTLTVAALCAVTLMAAVRADGHRAALGDAPPVTDAEEGAGAERLLASAPPFEIALLRHDSER